jgi:TonB family protein
VLPQHENRKQGTAESDQDSGGWWWRRLKTGEKVATVIGLLTLVVAILAIPGVIEFIHPKPEQSPTLVPQKPDGDTPSIRKTPPRAEPNRSPLDPKTLQNPTVDEKPPRSLVTRDDSTRTDRTQASVQVAPGLSEADSNVLLIKRVAAQYPPLARQARIQGTVTIEVTVNSDGTIKHVRLISGHPMLAPSAIEAIQQWRYKPYVLDGKPVEFTTIVNLHFSVGE